VASPQVRAMVSFVCRCCPWLVLTPKWFQLRTNHLVWVLCRPVWVSEACQLFLVPSQSSNTPLYPSKCCELGNVPWLFFLSLFFAWTHIWVFHGVGSASKWMNFMTLTSVTQCFLAKTQLLRQIWFTQGFQIFVAIN
jgi:hypothetical protein